MTWPMRPSLIRSLAMRQRGSDIDCTPTCITRLCFLIASHTWRASSIVCVIGFSQYTSLPAAAARSDDPDLDRLVGAEAAGRRRPETAGGGPGRSRAGSRRLHEVPTGQSVLVHLMAPEVDDVSNGRELRSTIGSAEEIIREPQ